MSLTQFRVVVVLDAVVITVFTAGYVVGNYLPIGFAVAIVIGMGFQIWAALRRPTVHAAAAPGRTDPPPEETN